MSTGKLSSHKNEYLTIIFIKNGAVDNCLHTTGQLYSVYLAMPSCHHSTGQSSSQKNEHWKIVYNCKVNYSGLFNERKHIS